jgi:hypothetical protein
MPLNGGENRILAGIFGGRGAISLPFCSPERHKLSLSPIAVYPSNRAVHP